MKVSLSRQFIKIPEDKFCLLSLFSENIKRKLDYCGYSTESEISEDLKLSKLALAKLVEEMTSIEAKDYIIELKRNRLYKWMGEVQCDLYDFFHSSEYKCPKEFKEWMIWKQLDQLTKHTMTKIIKRSELEERAYEVYLRVRVPDEWMGFINTCF
ncbi:uncharacterized protein LOC113279790 [Papaver somniferum]|uniref:uncharacterized protein LOC113279790 n=1 Tax=Papaver somniferum TaxID=3469 RepID=UPI000E70227D|nr:uncharacterized protein LOC113279790 [Papaver somniferum]